VHNAGQIDYVGVKAPSKGVATPYGLAEQQMSKAALAARNQVEQGASLYRIGTTGKSQGVEAQFWSLEPPTAPGFAARYGIPPENIAKANFVEVGKLKPGTPFITRQAPGVGSNPGAGIEIVVPENSVQVNCFSAGN
jgi:LysM repeat protein